MMTLNVGIAGAMGRMGRMLVNAAQATPGVTLTGVSERAERNEAEVRSALGLGAGVNVTSEARILAQSAEAVIDFTTPEATLGLARAVAAQGGIHIIGTTGLSLENIEELKACAGRARIVQSGNFSLGVNLLQALVERAAAVLGEDYDIEIYEAHHRHKVDAPSGTALMLGEAAAKGRNVALQDKKIAARDGMTGARKAGDIGFAVVRGGGIVGDHRVLFAGEGETVELRHEGFSREIYARGALKAALWAKERTAGLYSMRDVLGV